MPEADTQMNPKRFLPTVGSALFCLLTVFGTPSLAFGGDAPSSVDPKLVKSIIVVEEAQQQGCSLEGNTPLTGAAGKLLQMCQTSTQQVAAQIQQVASVDKSLVLAGQEQGAAAPLSAVDQKTAPEAAQNLSLSTQLLERRRAELKAQTGILLDQRASDLEKLIAQARQEAKEKREEAYKSARENDGAEDDSYTIKIRNEAIAIEKYADSVDKNVKSVFEQEATNYKASALDHISDSNILGMNAGTALQGVTALSGISGGNNSTNIPNKPVTNSDTEARYATNTPDGISSSTASLASPGNMNLTGGNDSASRQPSLTPTKTAQDFADRATGVRGALSANVGDSKNNATGDGVSTSTGAELVAVGSTATGSNAAEKDASKNAEKTDAVLNSGTMAGGGGIASSPASSDLGLSIAMNTDGLDFSSLMNNMLGDETPKDPATENGLDGRSLASLGLSGSNSGDHSGGLLEQNSETLFKRVKSANVRALKRGLVINGLNAKI